MAIGQRNSFTSRIEGIATTSVAVPLPTGSTAGDMLILLIATKAATAGVAAPTAPGPGGSWTALKTITGGTGGGSATTGGQVWVGTWYKEMQAGESNPTTGTFTAAPSPFSAYCLSYSKAAGEAWSTPLAGAGGDTTGSATAYGTVTSDTSLDGAIGDWLTQITEYNDDVGTFTSRTLTWSGKTLAAYASAGITNQANTLGNDNRMDIGGSNVTAGSGSTAPTFASVWSGAIANYSGATVFVRLRVTSGVTGTGALTATAATASGAGTLTLSGTGGLGATAATASGAGAVRLSGTGSLAASTATLAGAGTTAVTGTGTPTATPATLGGAGTLKATGAGSLTAAPATAAGAGVLTASGAGSLTAPPAVLGAAGALTVAGTGGLSTDTAGLSATGSLTVVGVGAVAAAPAALSGSGSVTEPGSAIDGAGALTSSPASLSATGTLASVGAAELNAQAANLAGAALLALTGQGALTTATAGLTAAGTVTGDQPASQPRGTVVLDATARYIHLSSGCRFCGLQVVRR